MFTEDAQEVVVINPLGDWTDAMAAHEIAPSICDMTVTSAPGFLAKGKTGINGELTFSNLYNTPGPL